ncbi:putative RNA-directed DNA polymerase from mobile element jockey-like [Triplophysa rosa]|uniref:RNA-directed DNA polymerase from mobile element jockey-like n=1 Tax=Triplophysa rosa TaxID=992332 RepID=A0A9W7TTC4_TRIRA|nr:putative RNA-directed DNA polymerase from mobile element jockey-like [Triplophysa rosa]
MTTQVSYDVTALVKVKCHKRSSTNFCLLKDKEAIASRWKEHYGDLLNRDTTPEMEALEKLPQQPINESMGEPPSLKEGQDAIRKMKNNKAAGPDGIPAEVLKEGGPDLLKHIHALLYKIWEQEKIPAQLKDVLVVSIFKKGDKADCGNYRGISLLSTTGKALARVLANRLTPLSESILPESQSGFCPNRGTADMIFIARQLQEKCREQNLPLYMAWRESAKTDARAGTDRIKSFLHQDGGKKDYSYFRLFIHASQGSDPTQNVKVDQ